ncbi:TetR/AcrR family transcriptional regulator C-terminal domain-containing protein [Streptomyces sp. NPDC090445]|uniref:TetR/AcrR family transcriptional regulator C-terminal domain-containing protein n=1 Tax=Streptomyces sp. NPDC090445 TaxID=3365963 RepID=UPI003829015C
MEEGLRLWAAAMRSVHRQRPWLTRLPVTGPPAGPHRIAWMEAALAVLARTPLDWAHKIGALSLLGGYVVQAVLQEHEFARSRAEDQSQADAEHAWSRALAHLVDPERFPESARLFASAMFDAREADAPPDSSLADADFSTGLELILDGIATRIEHATP